MEYAASADAVDSYLKAGYKTDRQSASKNAKRLLEKPEIKARLQELTNEMRSEKIATAAEIQEQLTAILRGEAQEEVVVLEGIEKGVTEAKIVMKRASNADRVKAGQTLAKMQGAFNNTLDVNVQIPVIGGESELEA